MGYGTYEIVAGPLKGQMGGYNVDAVCGHDGCTVAIDRGLDYMCGRDPHGGGDDSCGQFFCHEHLYSVKDRDGNWGARCDACSRVCPTCEGEGIMDGTDCTDCPTCTGNTRVVPT